MSAHLRATRLRDHIGDAALRSADMTGDDESFVVAVCVGRAGDEQYINVSCTRDDVGVTEAITMMLSSIEKMLPRDGSLRLVVSNGGGGENERS